MGICFECLNTTGGMCERHLKKEQDTWDTWVTSTGTVCTENPTVNLDREVKYLRQRLLNREGREALMCLSAPFAFLFGMLLARNSIIVIGVILCCIYWNWIKNKIKP